MIYTTDIPYRFTGKERDEETGLYYYGARYLDGKASRWLSTDPAVGDYIPGAPVDDEAKYMIHLQVKELLILICQAIQMIRQGKIQLTQSLA
jgi:hypothetical protein